MNKTAFITGVTGQDGAYLSEFLLKKGYTVHGLTRRTSLLNTDRIDHLYEDPHIENQKFILHYGDMTDSTNLIRLIKEIQPDEIYNLAAMSHVDRSIDAPKKTIENNILSTLNLLENIVWWVAENWCCFVFILLDNLLTLLFLISLKLSVF